MWALKIETELSFKEQLDQVTSQADNSDELHHCKILWQKI
jgi:hypothetical protein